MDVADIVWPKFACELNKMSHGITCARPLNISLIICCYTRGGWLATRWLIFDQDFSDMMRPAETIIDGA